MEYRRFTGTSGQNEAKTVSTGTGEHLRILSATVKYSAAPTQTGVTVTINSGSGAAFDTLISTGTANAQNTFWQPGSELILHDTDSLDVVAPAGGGVITASIEIRAERIL